MLSITKWILAPALVIGLMAVTDSPKAKADHGFLGGSGFSISIGTGYAPIYRSYYGPSYRSIYGHGFGVPYRSFYSRGYYPYPSPAIRHRHFVDPYCPPRHFDHHHHRRHGHHGHH